MCSLTKIEWEICPIDHFLDKTLKLFQIRRNWEKKVNNKSCPFCLVIQQDLQLSKQSFESYWSKNNTKNTKIYKLKYQNCQIWPLQGRYGLLESQLMWQNCPFIDTFQLPRSNMVSGLQRPRSLGNMPSKFNHVFDSYIGIGKWLYFGWDSFFDV